MDLKTLHAYGDKELWYMTGEIPEGSWSIPFWVHRFEYEGRQLVRVVPISVLPFQAEHIARAFSDRAMWKQNGSYLVEAELLARLAHKAPGVTPEFYRRWPGQEPGVPQRNQLQIASQVTDPLPDEDDDETFFKYLAKRRGLSYNLIKLVWWGIQEEGAKWMLTRQRPINLGFVKLYPFPFRANWKEVVLSKHPTLGATLKKPPEERDRILEERGFMADICCGENISLDSTTHTIRWVIEAVPDKKWGEEVSRTEAVVSRFGREKYVGRYEELIAKLVPQIMEALHSYLNAVSKPFALVRNLSGLRGRSLVSHFGKKQLPNKAAQNRPISVVVSDNLIGLGEYSNPPDLSQEVEVLHEVPPIPPEINDVREPVQPGVLGE